MQAQILEFLQSRGLPPEVAPDLEAFILQLTQPSTGSPDSRTIDGFVDAAHPGPGHLELFLRFRTLRGQLALHRRNIQPPSWLTATRDLGPIGRGGMAEVRRVRDIELNRTLAMKTVHPRQLHHPQAVARFVAEAQATAQLQHPNIVPVHDIGRHDDGRVWFTMREVHGQTLAEVLAEARSPAGETRWHLRQRLDVFLSRVSRRRLRPRAWRGAP